MTFRGRLVLAATAAVLVVVVVASVATYLVAYNSLVGSLDVSLSAAAQSYLGSAPQTTNITNGCTTTPGACIQLVVSTGSVNSSDGPAVLDRKSVV